MEVIVLYSFKYLVHFKVELQKGTIISLSTPTHNQNQVILAIT